MEEITGHNGHTLKECLSKSLSDMCADPRYIEDLQTISEELYEEYKSQEDKIRKLTIVLEHYELKAMEKERTQILYRHKYRKEES